MEAAWKRYPYPGAFKYFLMQFNTDYSRLRETFLTPYDQYKNRNGQSFSLIRKIHPNEYDEAECGPMYVICFDDGKHIDVWPEEIFCDRKGQPPCAGAAVGV